MPSALSTLLLLCISGGCAYELIRAPLELVLRGSTHLELARSLLSRDDVLNRLIESEFSEDAPVLVPLCWSTAEWSSAELAELQWPPLVTAQAARDAELRSLAEQHAQPDDQIWNGRLRGARALLAALELVHCHAFTLDGELWLLPEAAQFGRSAPYGASLERCESSGDLLVVTDDDGNDEADGGSSGAGGGLLDGVLKLDFLTGLGGELGADDEDEFRIGRGAKSNDELLLTEGWASEALSCDAFGMPADVLRAAAAATLGRADFAHQEAVIDGLRSIGAVPRDGLGEVMAGGRGSDSLARSTRALCLSADELAAGGGAAAWVARLATADAHTLLASGEGSSEGSSEGGAPAEARLVASVLASACSVLLDGFATSADEDAALLEAARRKGSDSLSDVRRVASLRSRLSRKRCLRQLRDACAPP